MDSALKIVLKIYSALGLIACLYGIGVLAWGAVSKGEIASWGAFGATVAFFIFSFTVLASYLWAGLRVNRKIFFVAFVYLVIYLGVVVFIDVTGNQFGNLWQYLFVVPLLIVAGAMASNKALNSQPPAAGTPQSGAH